jgi:hypothetical protein
MLLFFATRGRASPAGSYAPSSSCNTTATAAAAVPMLVRERPTLTLESLTLQCHDICQFILLFRDLLLDMLQVSNH